MKDGILQTLSQNKKIKLYFANEKAITFDELVDKGQSEQHIVLKNTTLNQVFHVNLNHVVFARIEE